MPSVHHLHIKLDGETLELSVGDTWKGFRVCEINTMETNLAVFREDMGDLSDEVISDATVTTFCIKFSAGGVQYRITGHQDEVGHMIVETADGQGYERALDVFAPLCVATEFKVVA